MPKMNKSAAAAVAKVKSEPVAPGWYVVRLEDVEEREGPKGPYWSWRFAIVTDVDGGEDEQGRAIYNNTTLKKGAQFGLKQTFDAFGVSADTDTDELIGNCVRVLVSHRVIPEGERKGDKAANVARVAPLKEGDAEKTGAAAGGKDDPFGDDDDAGQAGASGGEDDDLFD